MDQTAFLAQTQKAMLTVLIASGPALAIAIVIGVSVGLIQALTQIQDQTLPQAVKLVAVMLALIVLGPTLAVQVADFASNTLDVFPALTR